MPTKVRRRDTATDEASVPPSPPVGALPPGTRGYIHFLQMCIRQSRKHQAAQERQIRHLREDCLRMHEMMRALIHRASGLDREALSAERLLSRLHYRVEQRFGPGGDMLVPRRLTRPSRKRIEKPRPW